MSKDFELTAIPRQDVGKGASRRLRKMELVPGIIYGADQAPVNISLQLKDVKKALENEAFYSHILKLGVDGQSHQVLLKDLQRHPFKPTIMHMDFQRVTGDQMLQRHVPLHFMGEDIAPGVKISGGIVMHYLKDVEISCAAKDLPEYIAVDISTLQLDEILHLSDVTPPKGVSFTSLMQEEPQDLPVAAIHLSRGAIDEESASSTSNEASSSGEKA